MNRAIHNIRTIATRELYSYFASPIAYVFLVIFLGLAGWFTFQLGHFFDMGIASLSMPFFTWHPWIFMIFVPAIGMRLWAQERRSGTLELLFTLPTTVGQAVVAKFVAGALFLALALALTFPMVITVNILGDPDNGMIASGYLGSLLVALTFLSISSFTSSLTRDQIVSFIVALVICLLLILCGYPPVLELLRSWQAPTALIDLVASFSIVTHYESLQRGVIDTRDLLYFGGMIVFGLFGTGAILRAD